MQDSQIGERYEPSLRLGFDVFDRSPDPALDELVGLAAVLCGADYAYTGWMDSKRLWYKSHFGFAAPEQSRTATGCHWMLESGQSMLIRDAAKDPRFPREGIWPFGAKPCRSYAGTPLNVGSEQFAGTLAILAREPDRFSKEHLTLLEILSHQVVTRLELYARIRAQEKAQRALQLTERALATERCFVAGTLDSIPFLAALLDTAGRTVRLNYPCMQLTGLSQEDAVGRPFIEKVLEMADHNWAEDKLREATAGLVSGPHETNWRTQGGRVRHVSWTLRPLPGPTGDIQYLIVSGQDVTEQREAEMALLSSETRYQQVVENSLGFLFTCSTDGRLTSLNAFTAETLGYRAESLTGRAVSELLDGSDAATFQECLRTLQTGKEWQGSLRLRRGDGAFRRIAFRSRRMELPGEKPFILNHGIDVTEQHEAEEALTLATRQRELILESVGDGIYGIDLYGRLTFVNQAAARTLGYTPEELTGRDLHESVYRCHADGTPHRKSASPILVAMHKSTAIRMRDEVFWRQDGVPIPVDYSASPMLEEGRISGMVVAFQDISERRRLEKMKDEFLSTVGHELRTPLTSLRASLGLISSGSLDKRPEKRMQMFEMAIGNCDRLVKLVNDILDFDSVEKGRLALNRKPTKAIDLLNGAAAAANRPATAAHIQFGVEAENDMVLVDEERILKVLGELITNAIKFSPPETRIKLAAHVCDANPPSAGASDSGLSGSGLSSSSEICFMVEDEGRGIPPEKLDKIFDRFHQGDASDSRARGGTGLGLALCRSIIEQHGGRIWVESMPDKGSRFLFTVPMAPAHQPVSMDTAR
ncbi:MAG: PAS domain S-box protein [Terracidiphilus sp.]